MGGGLRFQPFTGDAQRLSLSVKSSPLPPLHLAEKFLHRLCRSMAVSLWRARTASSILANIFDVIANTNPHKARESIMNQMMYSDINSQIGSCMPLSAMRIGTIIHNIELNPGQGGKLVRAAGTSAKILKEPTSRYCLIQLPSGVKKLIDSRSRATIGTVYTIFTVAVSDVRCL